MVRRKKPPATKDYQQAQAKYPHLRNYVSKVSAEMGEPEWHVKLDRAMKKLEFPNIIYPVGDPLFIHIFRKKGGFVHYHVIEPEMTEDVRRLHDLVMDRMIEIAHRLPVPDRIEEAEPILLELFQQIISVDDGKPGVLQKMTSTKIHMTKEQYETVKYFLIRNRVGYGKLEPLFLDPYLEDIHCVGVGNINTVHKIFDMVHTNINFPNDLTLNKYMLETSERVERPVSDANSVVDAIMPDGSRVNFIYGREVSLEGSSFTVRKFSEVPVSITQIVNWKTMSAEEAAYIWLMLENGMNVFVCGETASGKTTTLNASVTFIKPDAKVYTVENTPEVTMPHETWQHLVTREAHKETDVTMFDLLIAALRSRPNYIIVGEIRGAEGNVAFQAMQTGHPVMSTFHAGSVHTMIQRITGDPINVPIAFVDNLNVVLIQQAVQHEGHFVRRVLSITEIERYYDLANKVLTRQVFAWDPVNDEHRFRGLYNSFLLEKKIAAILGYEDTRDIYKELDKRKRIIEAMVANEIFDYFDVWELIKKYSVEGESALPFRI